MIDWIHLAQAFFLGIIEGLTEFLPISSTGHLILTGDWISFASHEARVFEVVIQLGAILAVCWLFRAKIVRLSQGALQGDPATRRFVASVLLVISTMLGAAVYDASRNYHLLNMEDVGAIAAGFVAAFISALFVVNAMIRFVAQHSLRVFAWYRIALGLLIGVGIVTSAG